MQAETYSYPIRIVSRKAARKRTRRISSFILGVAFGVGCVSALSPSLLPQSLISASNAPAVMVETAAVGRIAEQTAPAIPMAPEPEPVVLVEAEPEPDPRELYPLIVELRVENGDTLINMLTDVGAPYEEAHLVVEAVRKVYNPRTIDVGQLISVRLDMPEGVHAPVITELSIPVSSTSMVTAIRQEGSGERFLAEKIDEPVVTKLARAGGRINSSLYETGVNNGLPLGLINEIITAYSYDIDFQRDIKAGNDMDVLFEQIQTRDGDQVGYGNVLFAQLDLGDRQLKIYRYTDKNGDSDYYNEKGESVRKALLRTPINGARITSRYGKRMHPILGYNKMHRGVDFGAPTGTPIYAAGDGKVEFAGRKGGYGNYLRIRHNGTYASAYAHISRFAKGIAPGTKVKQGQIIAYVGSTGASTGPHLHYEILANGVQVNPSGVKFKTGTILKGKELAAFKETKQKIETQLASIPRKIDLAMNKG